MTETTAALADYRWLVGPEAEGWLRRVAEDGREPVALAASLRKELSSPRTHLILEQTELRGRAARKFADARRMFFTRVGLEQATDQVVAAHKARRFPSTGRRVDLCCGVGGDLLALAAIGPTLGVDRDRVTALLASENLRRLGHERSRVAVAEAGDATLDAGTFWHVDPDRRPDGRRSVQLRWHSPDQETIEHFRACAPSGAVKLAPATDVPDAWREEAELEWISRDHECRQQVAWFGNLAEAPGRSKATVIRGHDLASTPELRVVTGTPGMTIAPAQRVGRYVVEPDPAVLAADLSGTLAAEHHLEPLTTGGVYLTADRPITDLAMSCFEIVEVAPFDKKRLKRLLAARGLGRLEIKTRGLPHDPESLRRELRVKGDAAGVLLLSRFGRGVSAILARRM
jgi:hypothetical protein